MRETVYRICLPLILVISFLIRLVPHRTLLLATYDEYLHRDITLRLVHNGIGSISRDLPSLLGLKAYSYPPLFHIIGAMVYRLFPSNYVFFVLPAVYGTIAVFGFYLVFRELTGRRSSTIIATIFLAFAPNFIYRTSLYIPENLGLVLFSFSMLFLIRFLRSKRPIDFIVLAAVFSVYTFTHRGWVFFMMAAFLIVASYSWSWAKRNLHYIIVLLVLTYLAYLKVPFVHSLVGNFFVRIQKTEVSFLGYFKWIGVVQLVFGALATPYYLKKDPIRRGFALWAWAFLLAGGISFRFRDPYSTIPLAVMAAEYLVDVVFPSTGTLLRRAFSDVRGIGAEWVRRISGGRAAVLLITAIILLTPFAQGVYGAYKYVNAPTISDKEAYEWISQNTPENATILVWWDMGYLLIGNTHRKDVVIWKKVYQGFFGKAPTAREAQRAYTDQVIMFSSPQREYVYYLMKKYNVSYVFVDRRRLSYGLIKYGLMEYAPYDTHFKLEFCNGNAQIYKFIPSPPILPTDLMPVNYSGKYSPLVGFLEKFWTGYNYADFDDRYKAYFNLNAWMVNLYEEMYKETGNDEFKERAEWLLKWLSYKEMNNGAFPWGVPPNDYTLYTAYTLEPLSSISFAGKPRAIELLKEREKANYFMTTSKDRHGIFVVNALFLPIYDELGILNSTTRDSVLGDILKQQRGDGSWNENVGTTLAISSSLARYYQLTGNETVFTAVKKAAKWLTEQQDENGKLKLEKAAYPYSRATYAEMVYVYKIAGLTGAAETTLKFIEGTFDPNKEVHPLEAVLMMYKYLSYAYGPDSAIGILNKLLEEHPLLKFS